MKSKIHSSLSPYVGTRDMDPNTNQGWEQRILFQKLNLLIWVNLRNCVSGHCVWTISRSTAVMIFPPINQWRFWIYMTDSSELDSILWPFINWWLPLFSVSEMGVGGEGNRIQYYTPFCSLGLEPLRERWILPHVVQPGTSREAEGPVPSMRLDRRLENGPPKGCHLLMPDCGITLL